MRGEAIAAGKVTPHAHLEQIMRMARDVASGLAYLHAEGVVHGDLKVCVLHSNMCCMRLPTDKGADPGFR